MQGTAFKQGNQLELTKTGKDQAIAFASVLAEQCLKD